MLKLAIKNLFNSYINSILLIISIIIAILTFSVGVEYVNYFYQSERDKAILSEHSDKISINLNKAIEFSNIVKFINNNKSNTIISGEFPITIGRKRVFLTGINKNSDLSFIPLYKGKLFSGDDIKGKKSCISRFRP
jgi:hypothetical protein